MKFYWKRCGFFLKNASFQIENNKLEGNKKGSMHASLEKLHVQKKKHNKNALFKAF